MSHLLLCSSALIIDTCNPKYYARMSTQGMRSEEQSQSEDRPRPASGPHLQRLVYVKVQSEEQNLIISSPSSC